ncbi:serine hydrolase [Pseudoduganella sp. SL102]|uniref:serine hydrolase domain-containing protein n=1 Tax=Pseudoduganella sp. SL102 TaxID=2995154 RepID=UPI00248AEE2C|nr:serine hydrolase domain-containing protein [Pseudoduganella sp. SL102]WBS00050.1 serine hydrolase [Pseudoduganella sp. SL102]
MPEALAILAKQHKVCGVAVAVIRQRKLETVHAAAGCRAAPPPGADSVFQAASLSKPLFAYAVLQLAREGKLDLDAPLAGYLPQGYRHRHAPLKPEPAEVVTDPRLQAVTARMVLNHTAGLPNWASGPLRFDAAPGTRWQYSGEGYVLLQRAVEAVTGQLLDRFMASRLFEPLAMRHSAYVLDERLAPQLLGGTKANGAPRKTLALQEANAAFSLHTSAADYGRFLAALLHDGAAMQQVTASPVPVDADLALDWGLGWGIERGRDDAYIWQWGNNPGYRAFAIASLGTGDGLVMLTSSENGLALAEPLTGRILPGEHKLFQSPVLGVDVLTLLCNSVRLCL